MAPYKLTYATIIALISIALEFTFEETFEEVDCYTNSSSYQGKVSLTRGNIPCQRWDSRSPHYHSFNDPDYFPDASLANASNFCRDPDGEGTPWCFTRDATVVWDLCDVVECSSVTTEEDCYTNSSSWQGELSRTRDNITCQRWDSQTPHAHPYIYPELFPDDSLANASNFCRDPDEEGTPWCYTIESKVAWDFCNVTACSSDCDGFECSNGKCIKASLICDGDRDCYYGEDEFCVGCLGFTCNNGDCIPSHSICDGFDDCGANEDEYCSVPTTVAVPWEKVTTDCYTDASSWQGNVSRTRGNITCQRWDSQIPHAHSNNDPGRFPDDGLENASNFCRDTDGQGAPWCYTIDRNVRWDFCNVTSCSSGCYMYNDDLFVCTRYGVCIPKTQVCDQTNHCGDNSDELHCTECTDGSTDIKYVGYKFLPTFQTTVWLIHHSFGSHESAERECNGRDGHLLIIDSEEKLKTMIEYGQKNAPKTWRQDSTPHWIIDGRLVNGTWVDRQNRELLYTSFLEYSIPYIAPGNCLRLLARSNRGIAPADCSGFAHVMCEKVSSSYKERLRPHDFQVTASSYQDNYLPQYALKVSSDYGWCADISDERPFLQVDMLHSMTVTKVQLIGWIETFNNTEHWYPYLEQSFKGVKRFLITKSNTTNYAEYAFERTGNISELQGHIFQLQTSLFFVDDMQTFVLCDQRESRYIRIYPLEPWDGDVCLKLILHGVWKDVDLDVTCASGSKDVGLFNVGFGLVNKRHYTSCNNSSQNITGSGDICISNFSTFWRNAENDTESVLLSNSNRCKDECSPISSCNMAKYSSQTDTCYIYPGNLGDLPIIETEGTDEVIYQRLCLANTSAEDTVGKFVVSEEQKQIVSPGYPFPQRLQVGQEFIWSIDFYNKTTAYPVLLFEDLFFDDEVTFELQAAGKGHRLFEDVMTYQPSVPSPKNVCHLRVYYRFGTIFRETVFGFRVIVTKSEFPGSHSVAKTIESFYDATGILSSHIFNGVYTADFRLFRIESGMADYTALDILDFYVSCSTSIDKAELTIGPETKEVNFCNLRRPWKHLKFSPKENNVVVRLSFPYQRQEQSRYGITANFSLQGYVERPPRSNDSYVDMRRIHNTYSFDSADVIILLDATYRSVNVDSRLEYIKELVWRLKLTSTETNNRIKLGLCAFSDDADVIFQIKDDWNKTDLANWFRFHAVKLWKRRCFSCALSKTRNTMFNLLNGDRPGVPNIVVAILLDSPFSAAASKNELLLAEAEEIHVFVINTGLFRLNGITADMEVRDPSQLSVLSVMHALATTITVEGAIKVDKTPVLDSVWQVCSEEACYSLYPPIGKSGFEFFNTRSDANETCYNNHNGSLASIHSLTELQFIRHFLEQWIVKMPRSIGESYSVYQEHVHIDEMTLSKGNKKSIYHWSDGRPISFTAWSDEISRLELQRFCVVLTLWNLENDNIWNTGDCEEDSFYFLCKYAVEENIDTDNALSGDNNFTSLSNVKERTFVYFACGSSEYITLFSKCDGIRDCFDGSDEINCIEHNQTKADCKGMFHCDSGECVPYSQYCDYIPDCTDKSDEDCDFAPCNETEWQCTNGQCRHSSTRCNGFFDCLDMTDEYNCASCGRDSYRCAEGTCISNLRVCDGFADCIDSSDEDNCNPEGRESCLDWWKAGYRTTGNYKLTFGPEMFTFECDFERAETEGILLTKFNDIDRDHDDGSLFYSSESAVAHFLSTRTCTQTFTQTCLPNRKAIAENIDLKNHEEYWDCLCIEMAIDMINTKNKTLRACSNVTLQLMNDGVINLEDMWVYNVDYVDITDVSIRRNAVTPFYITNFTQNIRLVLGPITCEEKVSSLPRTIVCRRGKPVDAELKCLYDFDDLGHVKGCTDFSHLQTCGSFGCPIGYFKCPYSYCIAQRFLCDDLTDCPNGEDETICNSADAATSYCSGSFKCKGTNICLPEFQLCDGIPHCPEADDERVCSAICPQQCSCTGFEITCNQVQRMPLPTTHPIKGSVLHLTNSKITDFPFLDTPCLAKLNISSSRIQTLKPRVFGKITNLLILDLSYNHIRSLESYTFEGLWKLRMLLLQGNNLLSAISSNAFVGLQQITYLRISKTRLTKLRKNSFTGLLSLTQLDISQNQITTVEVGAFDGLQNLVLLNMALNQIHKFDNAIFNGLENLDNLVTDDYMFCCLKPESVSSENCLPHEDEFSSCSDLMRMDGPRYLLWVIGLSALVGNCLALVYRLIYDRSRLRIGYGIFVTNLCVSDFLMGVYLIIIAGADVYYRDIYVWNDSTWRFGALCSFAGVLSTISSEASVFFISLVTIDRLLVIKYPFGQFKFTTKIATIVSSVCWIFALLVAVMPLLYKDYFQDGFYSKNAVCLALPLTRDRPNGWEYSLVVFVFLNFATFLLIAIGQWLLYSEIHSRQTVRSSQRRNDLKIARNLLLVIATDFFCWCPIGVMGLMALSGHVISGDVYVWACVLILPINSALNPFLYTFSAIRNRKAFSPSLDEQSSSAYIDNKSLQMLWNNPVFIKPQPTGQPFVSLDEYLQSKTLNQDQIRNIIEMLKAHIEKLHSMEFFHGKLSTGKIKVQQINGEVTKMVLDLTPQPVVKPEDTAKDIMQIAVISRQCHLCIAGEETKM